jgi:hypothetical protein
MSKLHRRGFLAVSAIAAASALLVAAPAGASVAEELSDGSTSGEAVVEPAGNSTQPVAPAAQEGTPEEVEGGASGGGSGAAPLQHGSSVGSGAVPEKAGSGSEEPSSTPDPGGPYEPEPSTPPTVVEPVSAPRAGSGAHTAQPARTARASRPVEVAVGTATSLGRSASFQGDGTSSAPPAVAASVTDSGDRGSASSYVLPLLVIVVLGLILGLAGVRLRRRRWRRRLEALWREQDLAWEAALRRAELGPVSGASGPSAQRLQRINVG